MEIRVLIVADSALDILEIQVLVYEIVRKLEFSLPDDVTIYPATALTLMPVDGNGKGALPLKFEHLD